MSEPLDLRTAARELLDALAQPAYSWVIESRAARAENRPNRESERDERIARARRDLWVALDAADDSDAASLAAQKRNSLLTTQLQTLRAKGRGTYRQAILDVLILLAEGDAALAKPLDVTPVPVEHDIWINRARFRIAGPIYTGAELRYVPTPAVADDYDLWKIEPGADDRKIELTDSLVIADGLRFYTAPKVINAGRPLDVTGE